MAKRRALSIQGNQSESLRSGEIEFLVVGKLRRPHGIRGEIIMSVWTDFPDRLVPGMEVYVGNDYKPVHVRSIRRYREDLLISFDEYLVREDVGILRNQEVMVRTDTCPPLVEGELYLHQVLGMTVIDNSSDNLLGTITEIIETGANDVYVVRDDKGLEILLPAIDSVILDINIESKQIRVHLLPGLVDKTE